MNESPSDQIIDQRVRNRIIEVLDLFADADAFDVAVSNLEFWADWVDEHTIVRFVSPVFSDSEVSEIKKVDLAWVSVELDSSQNSIEWLNLSQAAERAIEVFQLRGRFSEDVENA